MKIFLNLLSEERKNKIQNERKIKLIAWQEFILVFIAIFFTGMLISTNLILKVELGGLESMSNQERTQENYRELQNQEEEIKKINAKTSALSRLKKADLRWTNVLLALDAILMDKISLKELVTDNFQITLIGMAETRDEMLRFKESIEMSECFANANIPLSDLMKKEDVEFRIDFAVEEKCIKQN